ncbi:MAG: hypothetical protein QOI76_4001 [Frankiales bacterium]|jgi:hypothetical protein|nr:hypothetical protein [Frankiales bacterium]
MAGSARVVFTWGVPGARLVVLTTDGAETVVELFHGLPAIELPAHRAGWAVFLDRLPATSSG